MIGWVELERVCFPNSLWHWGRQEADHMWSIMNLGALEDTGTCAEHGGDCN